MLNHVVRYDVHARDARSMPWVERHAQRPDMGIKTGTIPHHEYGLSEEHAKHWREQDTQQDDLIADPKYFKRAKRTTFDKTSMDPDEYQHAAARALRVSTSDSMRSINPDLVDEYAEKMRQGSRFPVLYLDHDKKAQEGRHRAAAAKQLGIRVPVVVIHHEKDES
jgi:hypothetical protein